MKLKRGVPLSVWRRLLRRPSYRWLTERGLIFTFQEKDGQMCDQEISLRCLELAARTQDLFAVDSIFEIAKLYETWVTADDAGKKRCLKLLEESNKAA